MKKVGKLAYIFLSGIFETNSGYNHHTKSGKLLIDKNLSENSRSLFKVLAGSQDDISAFAQIYPQEISDKCPNLIHNLEPSWVRTFAIINE